VWNNHPDGSDSSVIGEEELQEPEWEPAAIVEETGDRGAMKQMQSHGIPLKPTTVLRMSTVQVPGFLADSSFVFSGRH
jgi:hypothetical protein